MNPESRATLLRLAGLSVLDEVWQGHVPEQLDAWKLIIGIDVNPTATVSYTDGIQYLDEVDLKWELIADSTGLFDSRGEFLISVAGTGVTDMPWARVRRNSGLRLAHHLAPTTGEPEFVAMSLGGTAVCGVTSEEYKVWIVSRAFT